MARRMLNAQAKEDDEQRENIFRTRYDNHGKVCKVIIDGGSCANVVSTELVNKLSMETITHHTPYSFQFLKRLEKFKWIIK